MKVGTSVEATAIYRGSAGGRNSANRGRVIKPQVSRANTPRFEFRNASGKRVPIVEELGQIAHSVCRFDEQQWSRRCNSKSHASGRLSWTQLCGPVPVASTDARSRGRRRLQL